MSQWEREANREYKSKGADLQVYQMAAGAMVKFTIKPKPIYDFYVRHRTWSHVNFQQDDFESLLTTAIAMRTGHVISHKRLRHMNNLAELMKPYEEGPIEYDAVVSCDFYLIRLSDEHAQAIAAAFAGEVA